MLNIIIGYLIIINIVSSILMYIEMRTDLIKLKVTTMNFIYTILSIIGGSVGILVTSQMFGYKKDETILRKIIPLIIFVEVVIVGYILAKVNKLF